ncbi:MAG: hypothetical protein LBP55_01225 [Candidatus Adiutrix sp.]|jgi:hypothetical protein|nr:hypothetical protein [Candidatus Adiutrix sp.]
MTTQPIVESGMTFGPYPEGRCFYIEQSDSYTAIQANVKIAEFLLLRPDKQKRHVLWVVEAKSGAPRPEPKLNFEDFIAKIKEKLVNAFSLGWASRLKRHKLAATELPDSFKRLDLSKIGVKFVLVINGHDESWLPPIQEALNDALRSTVKTWAFDPLSVAVINDEMARKQGLILT